MHISAKNHQNLAPKWTVFDRKCLTTVMLKSNLSLIIMAAPQKLHNELADLGRRFQLWHFRRETLSLSPLAHQIPRCCISLQRLVFFA